MSFLIPFFPHLSQTESFFIHSFSCLGNEDLGNVFWQYWQGKGSSSHTFLCCSNEDSGICARQPGHRILLELQEALWSGNELARNILPQPHLTKRKEHSSLSCLANSAYFKSLLVQPFFEFAQIIFKSLKYFFIRFSGSLSSKFSPQMQR